MRLLRAGVVAVIAGFLSGCSSGSPAVAVDRAVATTTPTKSPVANVDATQASANLQPSPELASNSVNSGPSGRRVPPPRTMPLGTPPPLEYRKGAENSLIATTMNSDGQAVEVRIFKGHSQLARVEATWLGPKDKLLRITLRSGATVELHTDQLANLATATTGQLVRLAGAAK